MTHLEKDEDNIIRHFDVELVGLYSTVQQPGTSLAFFGNQSQKIFEASALL